MARTNPEMLAAFLALINTQMERKRDRSIAEEGRAFELAMNKMLLETRHKQEQSNVFLEQRLREISTIQERISKKKDDLSALGILSEGIKSTGAANVIEQSVMKSQATITKDQQEVTALEKDTYSNLGQKKVELTDYENTLGKLKTEYGVGFADEFTARYIVETGSTAHPDWITSGSINSSEYDAWKANLPKGSPTDRLLYATLNNRPVFEQGVKARAAQVAMENVKLRQPQIERAIPTTHVSLSPLTPQETADRAETVKLKTIDDLLNAQKNNMKWGQVGYETFKDPKTKKETQKPVYGWVVSDENLHKQINDRLYQLWGFEHPQEGEVAPPSMPLVPQSGKGGLKDIFNILLYGKSNPRTKGRKAQEELEGLSPEELIKRVEAGDDEALKQLEKQMPTR